MPALFNLFISLRNNFDDFRVCWMWDCHGLSALKSFMGGDHGLWTAHDHQAGVELAFEEMVKAGAVVDRLL